MKRAVIGIVETHHQALAVMEQLHEAGFESKNISVLFPDPKGKEALAREKQTKAPEGAAAGAGAGGILGVCLGALIGAGTLAIPLPGPFIAAGPIMAGLSGLAAGAAVGGLTGALVGVGVPEFEPKVYEGELRAGKLLVSVHTDHDDDRARAIDVFDRAGIPR